MTELMTAERAESRTEWIDVKHSAYVPNRQPLTANTFNG
jgi:hypothetical protein